MHKFSSSSIFQFFSFRRKGKRVHQVGEKGEICEQHRLNRCEFTRQSDVRTLKHVYVYINI